MLKKLFEANYYKTNVCRTLRRTINNQSKSNIDSQSTLNNKNPFLNTPVTPMTEVSPKVRRNNIILASFLFGSVAFVYYYSMSKMKDDDFSNVLEEEVNKETASRKKL